MKKIILAFQFLIFCIVINAQPSLQYVQILTGLSSPVDIENAGDNSDRLFIVEKAGRIKIWDNGTLEPTAFLDISAQVNSSANERGLLGVTFHPNYAENGYFFVNYTNLSGTTTISRFKVSDADPNIADVSSQKIMIQINQPYNNHNAGDLKFSPIDHYLYIPMGDGGSGGDPGCRSQDSTLMLGKILRIDVDQNENVSPYYGIPSDNPYLTSAVVPEEIWAFGLRNPWKIAFDSKTGDLWIADVGQNAWEEVNFTAFDSAGGENYGWAIMEGDSCYYEEPINPNCPNLPSCLSAEYQDPIFAVGHDFATGGFSITGGYVYRGCKYPELYGYYIAADYLTKNTWVMDSLGTFIQVQDTPNGPSSFGEAENGELYLVTLSGSLYEVRETTYPEVLTLTAAESPIDGKYQAADSIIVESSVTFDPFATVDFICPNVLFADDITIPATAILNVNRGICDE